MTLKQLALTFLLAGVLASPVAAQTAPAPAAPTPAAPVTAAPAQPKAQATKKAPVPAIVNINTASAAQLEALPQIGPKRSAAIIKGRPYKTTDELVTKKVLTRSVYGKIKDHLTAG
jgi:competence protein ComEA